MVVVAPVKSLTVVGRFLHPQVKVKQNLKQLFAEHLVNSASAAAAIRTVARIIKVCACVCV